jgi:hypothetical protein
MNAANVTFGRDAASLKAERIAYLTDKVHDPSYLENAIQRIATVLSRQLIEDTEEVKQW